MLELEVLVLKFGAVCGSSRQNEAEMFVELG